MATSTMLDTPMLKQYREIKQGHEDSILFFRLGDFYEMFLDDAKVASRELELTLTGRGKDQNRIPMCGIPYHAASPYINKLIQRGYKVAVCEQVEDPNISKGITKREVVKVITPGTIQDHACLDEKENNYLAAIIPIAKSDSFGGAYVDITTGEFVVFIASQVQVLHAHLERLKVKEILFPENYSFDLNDQVLSSIYMPLSIAECEQNIISHFQVHDIQAFGIDDHRAALPAAWAILDYLKCTQKNALPQITSISAYRTTDYLYMDHVTQKNLELTESLFKKEKTGTLFWVLDDTKTAMGARKLKWMIKNPFLDEKTINQRLDAVQELKADLLSREEIREVLNQVYDLERLIARIVSEQNNPKDCMALKSSLLALCDLPKVLMQLETSTILREYTNFFQNYVMPASPYSQVIQLIDRCLEDDPPATIKEGRFIREGYSEELDQLKLSFQSVKQWIQDLEAKEKARTDIKTLKVGFNKVFGYYIEVSKSQVDRVPEDYIRKQTLTNGERYVTPELKEKENILLHGQEKQYELEQSLFRELVVTLRSYIADLQALAQVIADLDTIQSLASIAQKYSYTRPVFVQKEELSLQIVKGRHPVLERNNQLHFIPNDVTMSRDENRFILITGPNMAGKSTIMRQLALIVIMAQIGAFVPAESVHISVVDKLFTRIGALDNLYFGQSTFMVEMLETATILNNATKQSLIVLDEIGRGTATYDGMSIACAVAEYVYHTTQARTLFATHYHELTTLSLQYPAFSNYSMAIAEQEDQITFKYEFVAGPADKSYGIHVAKMAGLPASVIKKADELLSGFETEGVSYLQQKHSSHQLRLF